MNKVNSNLKYFTPSKYDESSGVGLTLRAPTNDDMIGYLLSINFMDNVQ